jgi:hypothetical protein
MKKIKEKHGTKVVVLCAYGLIAGSYQNTQYEFANL